MESAPDEGDVERVTVQGDSFRIAASFRSDEGLPADEVARALGLDLDGVPGVLVPEVVALGLAYDFTAKSLVLRATTEHTDWMFGSAPDREGPLRVAAAGGRLDARASSLPVVGDAVPADRDLGATGLRFLATSRAWTSAHTAVVNELLAWAGAAPPVGALPQELAAGVSVVVDLLVAGAAQSLVLTSRGARAVEPDEPRTRAGSVVAREMDLGLGPVRVRRISLSYTDGRVFVALDALLAVGPVELSLLGLGFAIDSRFRVTPTLRGAGVVLDKPPVKVAGAVEYRGDPDFTAVLDGLLTVETGAIALEAAGSYARSRTGWSSMFLLGELAGTGGRGLFGPPAFTVTAVCVGFGINSTVRVPTIDQLGQFPLVRRLADGVGASSPREVLAKLSGPGGWITPHEGQYWGAGGIEFNCFRFLDARALLVVEGGARWKVMLLGRVTVDLPRNKAAKRPLARVIVDLALAYDTGRGVFAMDAVVAPGSYVLDPTAELTGGLSLYIWSGDRTATGGGQGFVFTLGGYHKDYPVPAYYPRPPRLGWLWSRGDVTIRGEVYAAVTDDAFMAGGRLEARYDKGHGIQLQAWFVAHVDALLRWKPFSFDVSLGLDVGVAATVKVLFIRVRVSLEVGVSLQLWGPPLGGTARVKVWFVSFTIGFGAGRDTALTVGWAEFRTQLPAPLAVVPYRGLLADVAPEEARARQSSGQPLLVSSAGFVVSTESLIPASTITLNGTRVWGEDGNTVSIRPMGRTGVRSEHRVTLRLGGTAFDVRKHGWTVTAVTRGMPRALWGEPLARAEDALTDTGGDGERTLLTDRGAGLRFEVPPPRWGTHLGPIAADVLGVEGQPPAAIPLRDPTPVGPKPVDDPHSIGTITDVVNGIRAKGTQHHRPSLHEALALLGVPPGADDTLDHYGAMAPTMFTDPPMTITTTK
ncbi:DUF6603 domain-containing protein [Actinoalloteichus caeruleus]|uniref:DUF6603 domain-containing protein n=1 Tax=Actinoalloteichus cyanogriseus TaxID=2893586 RepID=UPI003BB91DBE